MKSFNPSYVHCFEKTAQALLDKSAGYKEIVSFANGLNEKANQLLLRASLNKSVDMQKLQRDLFETGREYIKKFACKFNQIKITNSLAEKLIEKKIRSRLLIVEQMHISNKDHIHG